MAYDLNKFFKAISDPNRVKIMELLKDKELNVSEICQHFDMQQPSVSHHLSVLKNADIVAHTKRGKEVYYRLDSICITSCCNGFQEQFVEIEKLGKAGKAQ
ncbi:MAG: winged helix-turn-helix transcriptional regulator [FCB group bacterium]|nr:winged helix-turn-helix transcriptional regulator [FCB group bacterium]MBL7028346.1 winged helix-turn-helix transcriptional regulator [Candidatus Neomarinimicrobiota bacterium]MBL7121665.1 winged helix-turn-helix transcriptional regulator [Candidatus Neomarinimicrobiota bacterium]